jgi:succinate dehydrogenase / fumarate reductase cytochrome b subunit
MPSRARPLSPHLQIYRKQLTSVTSIIHRLTGVVLSGFAVLVTWGLVALASGAPAWNQFAGCLAGPLGRLATAAAVVLLVYHWLNGMRHLAWDTGWGLDLKTAAITGWSVVALTPILSALALWCLWT